MKRTLLYAFALFTFGASAQITITNADVANIGFVIRQAQDTMPSALPGPAGASQTWNFVNLNNHVVDTLTFTNPNWMAGNSSFPTSNLAVQFGSMGHAFLLNNSNGLYMQGQYGDFGFGPMVVDMNPDQLLMKFPATYLTNFSNNSSLTVQFPFPNPPFDSARVKSTTITKDTADAYGTVTTPLVSNINVLRTKQLNVTIDSFFLHASFPSPSWTFAQASSDSEWVYTWWANNTSNQFGFPLVEIRTDMTGTATGASWLMATPTQTGIAENNGNEMPGYPNPASDVITFLCKDLGVEILSIMDVTGKEVLSIPVKGSSVQVHVGDLPAGTYFYMGWGEGKSFRKAGKFIISR